MSGALPEVHALRALTPDGRVLFGTRIARLFAYGFVSVVLVLYLVEIGLSEVQIGTLLTLTLLGDTAISLWLTTRADRAGRRRTLIAGAGLMLMAGILFALSGHFVLLIVAATFGVISPSGNEIGPFLPIEQAALAQTAPAARRTAVFAWYNLAGSVATATGALFGGMLAQGLQGAGMIPLDSYRVVLAGYAAIGVLLAFLFVRLSDAVEADVSPTPHPSTRRLGLHHSRRVVLKLSGLFALDAFAGGLVISSIVAYWFTVRFGVGEATLGAIFFGANILAGISALLAARIAARIGLINTMVVTHLPSNVLLCLVPLMPNLPLAIGVLLLRFSISQMDVPTRQSYTMAVVAPDERSAASGVTSIARSVGASLSPTVSGLFLASPVLLSAPFLVAGGLKIIYDLLLYHSFRTLKPPEEKARVRDVHGSLPK
ncbi:MAG TPA: MFS transporter [Anaerolineae bacterium]|nr:MFS transporter [Anaerolineae bacterium]